MSAQRDPFAGRKRLPPYGRVIVDMLRARLRPEAFGGSVFVALDWKLASVWAHIVLPLDVDPREYDLSFLRGLSLIVVYRPGHPKEHIAAALEAIRQAHPYELACVQLPHLVEDQ